MKNIKYAILAITLLSAIATISSETAVEECPNGVYTVNLSFTASSNSTDSTKPAEPFQTQINVHFLDFNNNTDGTGVGWEVLGSLDAVPADYKPFFYQQDGKLFLPFKHFKDWSYTNSAGSPMQLEAVFSSTENKAYIFICQFEYNATWDVITIGQITKLNDMLVFDSNEQAQKVAGLKKQLSESLNKYMINMNAYENASKSSEDKQKSIEELQSKNSELNTKMDQLQKELAQKETESSNLKNELATQQQNVKENENQKQVLQGKIESNNAEILTLRNSKQSASESSSNYQAKADTALASINNQKDIYYQECANKAYLLDEAITALTTKLDVDTFVTKINEAMLQ